MTVGNPEDIFDRLMALWQEPWSEERFGEAQMLLARLRTALDLAIAHDRQPYPTADAYERVCAARDKWQRRAEWAEALLALLPTQASDSPEKE